MLLSDRCLSVDFSTVADVEDEDGAIGIEIKSDAIISDTKAILAEAVVRQSLGE